MSPSTPSVDDVYLAILERLGTGVLPLGSRLPSCRALAQDLDSNPSTVSRALQRLSADGLVRTEERRGTFVTATEPPRMDSETQITDDLERVIARASAAGYDTAAVRAMFDHAVDSAGSGAVVAFVECNEFDLDRMSQIVENATGVAVKPLLLDDLSDQWNETYDAVAIPLFHLADVAGLSAGLDHVVELNFVPTLSALREVATIDPNRRVMVVLPTARGVERVVSLVRQYYGGEVEARQGSPDDLSDFGQADVVITTHALGLAPDQIEGPPEVILLDWELDQHSAQAFAARVEAAAIA